jgi:hypothetical protein
MNIDELLKRLESIKIDEDEINERRKIAENLAQMPGVNEPLLIHHYYIMTINEDIYNIRSYEDWLKFGIGEALSEDAYVYVFVDDVSRPAYYYFPFLANVYLLPYAYLSKLGIEKLYYVVPAIGLKYVAVVIRYPDINRVVVEVTDIDTAATNTNLPTLTRDILGTKEISRSEADNIVSSFSSQELFAGYDFNEARDIINRYYRDNDTSLAKGVGAIKYAYNRIFQPYRVVYDLNTKQFIST